MPIHRPGIAPRPHLPVPLNDDSFLGGRTAHGGLLLGGRTAKGTYDQVLRTFGHPGGFAGPHGHGLPPPGADLIPGRSAIGSLHQATYHYGPAAVHEALNKPLPGFAAHDPQLHNLKTLFGWARPKG